jgi:hypothetical protein
MSMTTQSTYSLDGLTLTYRTVLTGTDLSPEWAMVRVRRALDDHRGESKGRPSDGQLDFDDSVASISMTGALLPNVVIGHVKAEKTPDGLAVIGTASLSNLLAGVVLSLAGITAFFAWHEIVFTTMYWIWIVLMLLAAGWHLHEIRRVLRLVTTAGTTL